MGHLAIRVMLEQLRRCLAKLGSVINGSFIDHFENKIAIAELLCNPT